jgi:hypothetical protein
VARDIDSPKFRFFHGCMANPNDVARVINAQAVQGFLGGRICISRSSPNNDFNSAERSDNVARESIYQDYICFKAARKIQTMWRCVALSRQYPMYLGARRIQTAWRCASLHRQYRNFIAARRIQSSVRKFRVLKRYTQFWVARRIQTCGVVRTPGLRYIPARRIQTTWRCKNAHGTCKTYIASRSIQTMWRCRHLRRTFVFFAAKRRIQTNWRG